MQRNLASILVNEFISSYMCAINPLNLAQGLHEVTGHGTALSSLPGYLESIIDFLTAKMRRQKTFKFKLTSRNQLKPHEHTFLMQL